MSTKEEQGVVGRARCSKRNSSINQGRARNSNKSSNVEHNKRSNKLTKEEQGI